MFTKSTLLATLFGCLVFNVLGWGIYGGFAADYFESQMRITTVEEMDPIWMSVGSLLMSFALTNIYRQWSSGQFGFNNGFNFGLWVGFFAGFGFGFFQLGAMHLMTQEGVLIDAIITLPFYGLVGGCIGWTFKQLGPKSIT